MSRIGRQPIPLPSDVTVRIEPELVTVKGPGGELSERIARDITVEQTAAESGDQQLVVTRPTFAAVLRVGDVPVQGPQAPPLQHPHDGRGSLRQLLVPRLLK